MKNLVAVCEKIIDNLMEYESDTFSASGEKLTRDEARAVLAQLIEQNIDPGMNIDGIEISEALEEVREPVQQG
jgi:hypothetical protein